VRGTATLPTTIQRIVGIQTSIVTAFAEAERRPLSIGLVLDNSYSLHPSFAGTNAIGYLRTASAQFVAYFDDERDRMSLSLFSTGTVLSFPLGHRFQALMTATFGTMNAIANTNLSDGLLSAADQLRSDPDASSFRALVFFTDGRPTALRDRFLVGGAPVDAVITGAQEPWGSVDRQLYRPDRLDAAMSGVRYLGANFPSGAALTVPNLQAQAGANVRAAAAAARADGITVYTIGLGNPNNPQEWKQPDALLLLEMANVQSGIDPETGGTLMNPSYDPTQPEGGFYFAPDAESLGEVFTRVASEIVLRLTQ
jgi:hypothetical protein